MSSRAAVKSITATVLAAGVGSLASSSTDSPWYQSLTKPSFQPPAVVFPIVWPVLYATIAGASARTMDRADPEDRTTYWRALLTNLTLNAAWSWVFFRAHKIPAATATAAGLAVSSTDLARRAGKIDKASGRLLLPYAAWCAFATVLTAGVWRLNKEASRG